MSLQRVWRWHDEPALIAAAATPWGRVVLWLAGCANHADFVEMRDHLSTVAKSQDQDQKRLDALQRRLESLERMKDSESTRQKLDPKFDQKFDELSARVQR